MLGEDDPFTLTALHNLALVKFSQGNVGGAKKLMDQVIEGRIRVFGSGHPETLRAQQSRKQISGFQDKLQEDK